MEECKDAILELSRREETFFGPFEMPLLNVQLEATTDDKEEQEAPTDEAGETAKEEEEEASLPPPRVTHMPPSDESLEMLAKLEPLPPLLENFDLDEHVGLIQRVLAEDPKLVEMQANLSGAYNLLQKQYIVLPRFYARYDAYHTDSLLTHFAIVSLTLLFRRRCS